MKTNIARFRMVLDNIYPRKRILLQQSKTYRPLRILKLRIDLGMRTR